MFILHPIIASFEDLLAVIEKGSEKNENNFPHAEVQRFLKCYERFNIFVLQLLQTSEVTIYQDLVLSLSIIEKSLTKKEGKMSFAAIVKAIQYFLVQIDKLLEEKQAWYSEKFQLEGEISDMKLQLESIRIETSLTDTSELSTKFMSSRNHQEDSNKGLNFVGIFLS